MKKVIVTCPTNGDMEITEEHARRLLSMPNNGGWVLKEEPKQVEQKADAGDKPDTEKAGKPKKGK
jgi:hypothetical protein